MQKRRYITTAIDYPNAAPHMGHVLEKVMADVTARWFRLKGDEVRFQIGTDEHGVKIQETAKKEGIIPSELVERNVPMFSGLYEQMNISSDNFIRTTDKSAHWPTVLELWKKLAASGVLEKRTYTGLYCAGCERFMTKKDLVDGLCPIHQKAPEEVKEDNWFFSLSKDAKWLKKLLTAKKDGYRIVPEFRANETLSLIEQGLEDVSFSRPKSSLLWGIPVPGDEDQTMYVWCDALTNYISGLDYFGLSGGAFNPANKRPERRRRDDHERSMNQSEVIGSWRVEWWDDAEVTHVIGKDIARFHALIWPAMLRHAGVRAPDRLLIHGFLTSEGEKMSKSLGNVVVPSDVISKYGVDALRFYLSHEIPVGNDGDFSWKRFGELYDAVLRNKLGNLLNRVLVLLNKDGGTVVVPVDEDLSQAIARHWKEYSSKMDDFEFSNALGHAVALSMGGNVRMDNSKPWTLAGESKIAVLSVLAEMLRHIALMLLPFVPDTAYRISKQLNVPYAEEMLKKDFVIKPEHMEYGGAAGWKQAGSPEILFSPVIG